MSARAAGLLLCLAHLGACDRILGLKDIGSDDHSLRLSFSLAPTSAVAQRPLDIIAVTVVDGDDKPVQAPGMEIQLTAGDIPAGSNLTGGLTATVVSDTAYFGLVTVDKPGSYTIVASADGVMPASYKVTVEKLPFTRISIGLDGGAISSIAMSAAPAAGSPTLFATTGSGVYTSSDGAARWKPPGLGGDFVGGFVVADPQRPGVAYAAPSQLESYLVKKTEDGGATWRALPILDLQLKAPRTLSIAIDPKDPSIIYATVYGVAPGSNVSERKLHRSTDGGKSWSTTELPSSCQEIAIDPVTTSNLYCAGTKVQRSRNSGASWTVASTEAPALGQIIATPEALFAVGGRLLHRSTDAASSWTPMIIETYGVLAYAPSMPRRIYLYRTDQPSGISVSSDAGATFGPPVAVPSTSRLAVDLSNPDLVYAATADGVYVSTNAGASWSRSSKGLDALPVGSVALAPATPGTLLASTPREVMRTSTGGASWTSVFRDPDTDSNPLVAFDPAMPTTAYACGFRRFATSTNGGASFPAGVDPDSFFCRNLAFSGPTVYVAGAFLRKSRDRGATWAATGLGNESIDSVAVGDSTGSVVLVAESFGAMFRSTDGGTTFTRIPSGEGARALLVNPRQPTNIIASIQSSDCHLQISTDGGATFANRVDSPCISFLSAAGSALYAAGIDAETFQRTLSTSTDGGFHWSPISLTGGVPSWAGISAIAASSDGKTIYLATSAGLYRSTDP